MNKEINKDQRSKNGHASAHPGAAAVSQSDLKTFFPAASVFYFNSISLNNVQKKNSKKAELNNADHQGITHEVSGPVKHGAVIIGIEHPEIIKDAGIQTNVDE